MKKEQGIFHLILFLSAINLVASIYDAAFPAMMLSRNGGSEKVLGLVNAVIGITTFSGSILASFMKAPKSRVRVICNCLLFSMSTENFLLAFGRTPFVWCLGGFLVDQLFEPIMAVQEKGSLLVKMFGSGKGSGAAFLFFVIAFAGIGVFLYFRRDRYIWGLEGER